MLFQTSFYDFGWTLTYSLSRLPFTCSTQRLDGLILNSVTVCMATDTFHQFAVVRRRQTCFASTYCTSPIFVTFLVFPITSKFIIFRQKNNVCLYYSKFPCQLQTYNTKTGTLTVTVHSLHDRRRRRNSYIFDYPMYAFPYNIFMLFYQLFFLRFGIFCN